MAASGWAMPRPMRSPRRRVADTVPRTVAFYFAPGSRYAYLAATQIPALTAETGAIVHWRPIHGADLIARTGQNPFDRQVRRGQYDIPYRNRDAARWAAFYGVPCRDPGYAAIDWKRMALACAAADRLDAAERFATALYARCFVDAAPSIGDAELAAIAADCGVDGDRLLAMLGSGEAQAQADANLDAATAAGAFGVPSFVTDDGKLFWGQDRLSLLRHHLLS